MTTSCDLIDGQMIDGGWANDLMDVGQMIDGGWANDLMDVGQMIDGCWANDLMDVGQMICWRLGSCGNRFEEVLFVDL